MITLHHLEKSRSQRVLWLLEELGLAYEVVHYQRDPETMAAPDSLFNIHPLGKSPILSDGELVIAESGAIIEYLIERYDEESRFKPSAGQTLLDYRYWLHFAEGSLMPLLVMKLVLTKMTSSPMPFFAKPIAKSISQKLQSNFLTPRLTPQLSFIEGTLAERTWFAGDDLSGADIQMSFPLIAASARIDLSAYPNIARFIKQVENMPNYQKSIDKVAAIEGGA